MIPAEISGRISGRAEESSKQLIKEADERLAKTIATVYASEKKIGSSQASLVSIFDQLKASESSPKAQVAMFLEVNAWL